MNILITGVGGPTPRSFAISLKRYSRFARYNLIGTDINPYAYGLYKDELFSHSYLVPPASANNYWEIISNIIDKHQISVAVILPEQEVLEWSKKQDAGELPCSALLPPYEMAKSLIDKARMTKLLEPLNLVPDSVEFSRFENDFNYVFDQLGKRFWVRSTSGTSGLGSLLIDSPQSLANWIQINPGVKQFIASTYLPGRNLACKMLYWNGKLLRSACAERVNYIMAKVAPSGITGNTSFGRLLNEPELCRISARALDALFKYTNTSKHGFFTVDFKEDENGIPLITEINVRHVAFTQCFAAGGANFAEDTIRLLSNDDFDKEFRSYQFEDDLIFLRDVDDIPVIMKEAQLLSRTPD